MEFHPLVSCHLTTAFYNKKCEYMLAQINSYSYRRCLLFFVDWNTKHVVLYFIPQEVMNICIEIILDTPQYDEKCAMYIIIPGNMYTIHIAISCVHGNRWSSYACIIFQRIFEVYSYCQSQRVVLKTPIWKYTLVCVYVPSIKTHFKDMQYTS